MGKAKRRRAAVKAINPETCAQGKGYEFNKVRKKCEKVLEAQSAQSSLELDKALATAATQQDPLDLQQMSAMQDGGESGGMSTTTIVAIAGGGIVLLGLAAYLILAD